jgi:signal transduction histidine kinase
MRSERVTSEGAETDEAARSGAVPSPTSGARVGERSRLANERPTDPSGLDAFAPAFAGTAPDGATPPAEWLESLLQTATAIPPGTPVREITTALLGVGARALGGVALGASVPDHDGTAVVVRFGQRDEPLEPAAGPERLFPEYAVERVLAVPHEDGATLHLACHVGALVEPGATAAAFADRLARALGGALRCARAHERSERRIDELHRLESQAIQTQKLASLGQMAAGIVHELNNPLTSIIAYSDFLRKKGERGGVDAGDLERLRRITEAAERIQRFARDLISYSRPAGDAPAPVVIHEVIDRALLFCEHVLDQTGVRVERSFAEVPAVRGVADQLTQVFVNLFTNAAQAMREHGGVLRITTRAPVPAEVSIAIVDDGHGIDAAHLPHIFDPFFTTKTDGTGTGLGLSIVRNIVVAHGGRIRADGLSPRGTAFYVELPSIVPAGEPTAGP